MNDLLKEIRTQRIGSIQNEYVSKARTGTGTRPSAFFLECN